MSNGEVSIPEINETVGPGEQGCLSCQSARLPPMCPGFDSRTRSHMWVAFVVGSLLCSKRVFSPGTPVFPSPQKPTFPNFNSILECTGISERVHL